MDSADSEASVDLLTGSIEGPGFPAMLLRVPSYLAIHEAYVLCQCFPAFKFTGSDSCTERGQRVSGKRAGPNVELGLAPAKLVAGQREFGSPVKVLNGT